MANLPDHLPSLHPTIHSDGGTTKLHLDDSMRALEHAQSLLRETTPMLAGYRPCPAATD